MIGEPAAAGWQLERLAKSSPDVVRLAELASIASRIETGLLRELRLALAPGADAGTEADLWFGPLVATRDTAGIALRIDVAEVLRERLAGDTLRCTRAREIVERRHAGTNPAQELEELLTFLALQPPEAGTDERIRTELRTALKAMVDEPTRTRDLARWAVRAVPRLPPRVRDTTAAWTLGLTAAAHLDGRPVLEGKPPDGALDDLQSLLPARPGIPVGVRAIVRGLELSLPPDPRAETIHAAPTDPVLVDIQVGDAKVRTESLRSGSVLTIDGLDTGPVRVTGADGSGAVLEVPQPDIVLLVGDDLERAASSVPTGRAIDRADVIVSPLRARTREVERIAEQVRSWREQMPVPGDALGVGELIGQLLPESFWDRLRQALVGSDGKAPSVLLLTDRGDIPWELAVGRNLPSTGQFPCLAMVTDLGIWLLPQGTGGPDEPFPLAVHCGTIVASAAQDGAQSGALQLPYARDEVARLRDQRGAVSVEPTADNLWPWLEGRFPCDILHIAAVGGFDRERGRNVIGLADGTFLDATTEVSIGLPGTVVVLNVPNAADPELVDRLLKGGAGAVIAPRWPVTDERAKELIELVYNAVFEGGLALGAALRASRQRATAPSNEDSAQLAYALYGHPATTVRRRPAAIAWDLTVDRPRGRALVGHERPITAVAWAPDGLRIATAGDDRLIREWDARTGRLALEHPTAESASVLAYSADGWLASDGPARLWQPGATEPAEIGLDGDGRIADLAWSPHGSAVAVDAVDGFVRVVRKDGSGERMLVPAASSTKLVWIDSTRLAVGLVDGGIQVFSVRSGEVVQHLQDDREPIDVIAGGSNGATLATVAGPSATLYDLATGGVRLKVSISDRVLAMTATPTRFRMLASSGAVLDWHEAGNGPPIEIGRIAPAALAAFEPGGMSVVTVAGSGTAAPEPQVEYAA